MHPHIISCWLLCIHAIGICILYIYIILYNIIHITIVYIYICDYIYTYIYISYYFVDSWSSFDGSGDKRKFSASPATRNPPWLPPRDPGRRMKHQRWLSSSFLLEFYTYYIYTHIYTYREKVIYYNMYILCIYLIKY